jgi:hypothetical protein
VLQRSIKPICNGRLDEAGEITVKINILWEVQICPSD